MKVHEFQAAALLAEYGVRVPAGKVAETPEAAVEAARALGDGPYVIKAQVFTGGRGKAGGVAVAQTLDDVRRRSSEILGMTLVTKQTGPQGKLVRRVMVSECVDIQKEYYISMTLDGASECVVMITSPMGGMDIEQAAVEAPEGIVTTRIDPLIGLRDYQARDAAARLGLDAGATGQFVSLAGSLYRLFCEKDCLLAEINPLALDAGGRLVAADAKMSFDDNALFRHPEIAALFDAGEEDPREVEASRYDLNYIQLDGNIGCMVNGAGLAMATTDIIQACGGRPSNFLDVGGSATEEKIAGAFSILLSDSGVRGVFVNIFGGIMRCDIIAAGIVSAAKKMRVSVPLVVRLEGTNAEAGRRILGESGLNIVPASDIADGARKICKLVCGQEACK